MSPVWQRLTFGSTPSDDHLSVLETTDGAFTDTSSPGGGLARLDLDMAFRRLTDEPSSNRSVKLLSIAEAQFSDALPGLTEDPETGLYLMDRPENQFGEDDRQPVPDASVWPFSTIGRLLFEFSAGPATGSGTLISRRHVVTAGHNVSTLKYGGWVKSIVFQPGASRGALPFGTIAGSACYAPEPWLMREDSNFDIAVVRLAEPVGEKAGFMGLAALDDDEVLAALKVAMTGYPGDKGGTDQYYQLDDVNAVNMYRFGYRHDTWRGQSGTSMYAPIGPDGAPRIVGVHTTGNLVTNAATRINRDVLSAITKIVAG
jgi:V8-like Glu-specific endopeptidase